MVLIDVDDGGPAAGPARRSRDGGRHFVLLLLGCLVMWGLSGCVIGQPDDSSQAQGDGQADLSEPAAPDEPSAPVESPNGNAGGPTEGGGAGGPSEALPTGVTPEESSACTQVPATDDAA